MIEAEGYKAFHGTLRVTPTTNFPPFELHGDFIYKPEYDCWYGCGQSNMSEICEVIEEAAPVAHGLWIIPDGTSGSFWRCSLCNERKFRRKTLFCPNCGAKMDKEATDGN